MAGTARALGVRAFSRAGSIELSGDHPTAERKPGRGVEPARARCAIGHCPDSILRRPHLDAQPWEAEVKRMFVIEGTPIGAEDAKAMVQYLATADGPPPDQATKESKPPKPAPIKARQ